LSDGGGSESREQQQQQQQPFATEEEVSEWECEETDASVRLQAGVLLAAGLLQHAPAMRPPLAEAAARVLLPWMVRAAGVAAADALLAEHPGGLWRHVRCAALAFLLGCAAGGAPLEAAWRVGVQSLHLLGERGWGGHWGTTKCQMLLAWMRKPFRCLCISIRGRTPCARCCAAMSPHPVVARLASAVLCGAQQASALGPQEEQLEAALGLLDELAAGEALAGACQLDSLGPASRLAAHLAAMLQVGLGNRARACVCLCVYE
jgi:hypothetical protein